MQTCAFHYYRALFIILYFCFYNNCIYTIAGLVLTEIVYSTAASDSTLKQLTTCGVWNTQTFIKTKKTIGLKKRIY